MTSNLFWILIIRLLITSTATTPMQSIDTSAIGSGSSIAPAMEPIDAQQVPSIGSDAAETASDPGIVSVKVDPKGLQGEPSDGSLKLNVPDVVNVKVDPKGPSQSLDLATASPSPLATTNPVVGSQILKDVISQLLTGMSPSSGGDTSGTAAKSLGPLNGLLPTLSKLSTPIARLIVSKGQPSVEDIDQILKAIPDLAMMLGLAGVLGAGGAAGVRADGDGAQNSSDQNFAGQSMATNFTWIDDQVDQMISGDAPLPPLSSLPREHVRTVLTGGALPGLTLEKTQALKQRYLQEVLSGRLAIGSGLGPLINVSNGNNTGDQSITMDNSASSIDQGMGNVNASQLPTIALQGTAPQMVDQSDPGSIDDVGTDLQMINNRSTNSNTDQPPIDILLNRQPMVKNGAVTDFSNDQALTTNGSIVNSSTNDRSGSISMSIPGSKSDPSYPGIMDPNQHDHSMYHQESPSNDDAVMWALIGLGIFGLIAIILIALLCWRRQRNRRRFDLANQHGTEGGLSSRHIRINPKSIITNSTVISEMGDEEKAIRDNRLNAEAEELYGRVRRFDEDDGRHVRRWE